ncbi:peptidoglycan-binding protein [Spiractinospora alimapuensis]|uniref:peptidoglycan-binding domain-containing protein n=1 Tax=Spiractinospora alimapuensis TaxID=2820884 RepID=UPI001F37422E|nr:peptidoglycan-binding domain-containing protein [Spiractinospora alimapuensis]QVQ53102.1 peptidoglycan-binding protein [Spiractinospora alimapuensis]
MLLTKRLVAGIASVGLLGTFGVAGATATYADGPESETPPELAALIMEQPWPEYSVGDEHVNIYAAKHLLTEQGFFGSKINDDFDDNLIRGTRNFQDRYGLERTGELDADTWQTLSDIYFPPGSGNAVESGARGPIVYAIQRLLQGHGYDVHRTGEYDDAIAAVEHFQRVTCTPDGETCLDVDGKTGEHTWRALVTGGI